MLKYTIVSKESTATYIVFGSFIGQRLYFIFYATVASFRNYLLFFFIRVLILLILIAKL